MRLALRLHLAAHRLFGTAMCRPIARVIYWSSKVLTSSDIDPRASIDPTVNIPHATGVVVGETAVVGPRTIIMPNVVLGARSWDRSDRHAKVGSDVVIGAGAVILGPVRIGDGAKVAANSVVLDDVAPGATVAGAPAKVVAKRTGPGVPGKRASSASRERLATTR